MRYEWSTLNRLQKGSLGEYFSKMEFSMYGLLVFSAEVDDRGIDFVARNNKGFHFDVQVKTITDKNYTYISESKFFSELVVCLVVLIEHQPPELFLFRGTDWAESNDGLLTKNHYPNAKEPEYSMTITKKRMPILERFRFDNRISLLL
jgi:hypothetical protein